MSLKTRCLFLGAFTLLLALVTAACGQKEVPVQVEEVTITARCRAKPPTEDWRCNNFQLYVVKTSGTKGEPLKRATWTLTGSGSSQICQPPFG